VLEQCPFILRAGLAGDHLRAIMLKEMGAAELGTILAQMGITVRLVEQVDPTLEDVFMALAKGNAED
jgi:hypothetical protein